MRGCNEKEAAVTVMNDQPTTMAEEMEKLKNVISNRQVMHGDKGSRLRQVQFDEELQHIRPVKAEEEQSQMTEVRNTIRDMAQRLEKMDQTLERLDHLPGRMDRMEQAVARLQATEQRLPGNRTPPGSPQRRGCFTCGEQGHFARDRKNAAAQ